MTNSKIKSLQELSQIIADLKKQGKTVAQSHGCFDLLHVGHVKHFEAIKKFADVLIVTLTQDKFINKGPGRPLYNENMRAEYVAALEVVDYVAINHWATATETIKLLKPDFYVKGQEYKKREDDITQKIYEEEDAIKEIGGEIKFTEEIVFSSTKIINAHMSPLDDNVHEYISQLKKNHSASAINKTLDDLTDVKILVIGDTIIDEYHYCTPLGKASKAPAISTIFHHGESYAGGVLAIANHLNQFAGHVELVTLLGTENAQQEIVEKKVAAEVNTKLFFRDDGPSNIKRRYIDTYLNNKLFEVTFMNDTYIKPETEKEILDYLKSKIAAVDMVMIADFGHGFVTPGIIKFLEASGKFLCVNAQTNSNNYGFNYITKYKKADYISIDEKELRLPFGDKNGKLEALIEELSKITGCKKIQITLGQSGSVYFENGKYYRAPAFASSVKDSVGAGDAVLSVTSLLAFKNISPALIPFIGNCTGAKAVEIIGNAQPVYKNDLKKFIDHFVK